jgi:hypothetical protein
MKPSSTTSFGFEDAKEIALAPYAPAIREITGPGFNVIAIDTRRPEGRQAMRDWRLNGWLRDGLRNPAIRLREAWASYRRTQANARSGERGYYATVGAAREAVRARVGEYREARRQIMARWG